MTSPSVDVIASVQASGLDNSTVGHRCPVSAPVWVGDHVTAAGEAITM